jgi:hypothetical protein
VRGEVFLEASGPLPADAIVRVELRDASAPDSVPGVIATQEFTASLGSPWAFELLAPDSLVPAGASLMLSARINAADRLLFATGDDLPVTAGEASGPVRLRLLPVTMSDGTGVGPGRLPVTPVPTVTVQCAGEAFRLAFEAGAAYVTNSGNTTITLPRLTSPGGEDPEAPRTFTNGRMTFVQETEGGGLISFARGRRVPQPCTRS